MSSPLRSPSHLRLVHAIVDRQIEEGTIVDAGKARSAGVVARLRAAMQQLLLNGAAGKISKESAKALFARAYAALMLAEMARMSGEVIEMVDRRLVEELDAVQALGTPVSKLDWIRLSEVKQREADKAAGEPPKAG